MQPSNKKNEEQGMVPRSYGFLETASLLNQVSSMQSIFTNSISRRVAAVEREFTSVKNSVEQQAGELYQQAKEILQEGYDLFVNGKYSSEANKFKRAWDNDNDSDSEEDVEQELSRDEVIHFVDIYEEYLERSLLSATNDEFDVEHSQLYKPAEDFGSPDDLNKQIEHLPKDLKERTRLMHEQIKERTRLMQENIAALKNDIDKAEKAIKVLAAAYPPVSSMKSPLPQVSQDAVNKPLPADLSRREGKLKSSVAKDVNKADKQMGSVLYTKRLEQHVNEWKQEIKEGFMNVQKPSAQERTVSMFSRESTLGLDHRRTKKAPGQK